MSENKNNKKQGLPLSMNHIVYTYYRDKLDQGYRITKIARMFNLDFATDYPESTLRNRYENIKKFSINDSKFSDLNAWEHELMLKEANIEAQRIRNSRMRSAGRLLLKEREELSLMAEIFSHMYGLDDFYTPQEYEFKKVKIENSSPVFVFGDVHRGYKYTDLDGKVHYNVEMSEKRVAEFFSNIENIIETRGLKQLTIVDNGDYIEGAALRVSQLANITELMSKQASGYTQMITDHLKKLSDKFPKVTINYNMVTRDNHSDLRLYRTGRGELDDNLGEIIANDINRSIQLAKHYGGMSNLNFNFADVLSLEIDGYKYFFAHGHQWKTLNHEKISSTVTDKYGHHDYIIVNHFHRYTSKVIKVLNGVQQEVVSVPAIVGQTDFGDRLFLSSTPGYLELDHLSVPGILNKIYYKVA